MTAGVVAEETRTMRAVVLLALVVLLAGPPRAQAEGALEGRVGFLMDRFKESGRWYIGNFDLYLGSVHVILFASNLVYFDGDLLKKRPVRFLAEFPYDSFGKITECDGLFVNVDGRPLKGERGSSWDSPDEDFKATLTVPLASMSRLRRAKSIEVRVCDVDAELGPLEVLAFREFAKSVLGKPPALHD